MNTHPPKTISRQRDRSTSETRAFTLTELLLVLALLALVAATQLSGLTRARLPVKGVQCQNNLRQLTLAWVLYANDHQNRLVNNYGASAMLHEINNQTFRNWANNVLSWDADPMNTNVALLRYSLLAPYARNDVSLYRCPADNFASSVQRAQGWTGRTRSVSLNGTLGSPKENYTSPFGDFYGGTTRQWYKTTEIIRPAAFWVLTDEHPDSLNDGRMINDIAPYLSNGTIPGLWSDFPGTYHDGAGPISFVDGHTEFRPWTTPAIVPVKYLDWNPIVDARGQREIAWFYEHSGVLYAP